MGLQTILESDDHYQIGNAKESKCSLHNSVKTEERYEKGKSASYKYVWKNLESGSRDMELDGSLSPYRRSMPSRPVGMDVKHDEFIQRRGSVYHSSREIRKMKRPQEHRRKVQLPQCNEDFISFEIVGSSSLCCQEESRLSRRNRNSPLASSNPNPRLASIESTGKPMECSPDFLDLSFRFLPDEQSTSHNLSAEIAMSKGETSDDLLEIVLSSENLTCLSKTHSRSVKHVSVKSKSTYGKQFSPETVVQVLSERDRKHFLPKSFSVNTGMISLLNQSDDDALTDNLKHRFDSNRRSLDPVMKSKSLRSPSFSDTPVNTLTINSEGLRNNKVFHRSRLGEVPRTANKSHRTEKDGLSFAGESVAAVPLSPIDLVGILKLERRNGVPSFEFSSGDMDDVLSAKLWRSNSGFNWVYTFHRTKKKTRTSGRGMKANSKQNLTLIGQMQVSCYICSEVGKNHSLDNSTVMEFMLYDIAQARRNFASVERTHVSIDATKCPKVASNEDSAAAKAMETSDLLDKERCKIPSKHSLGRGHLEVSYSHPWAPKDLTPHREIMAAVIQFPCKMKENDKNKKLDKAQVKRYSSLSGVSIVSQGVNNIYPANMVVVIPSGCHSLPCTEGCPSPLLARWKSGGICDCGGWDMGCPIIVFDNNSYGHAADGKNFQALQLYNKGTKEAFPAIALTSHGEGQYSVHFHAKFSALQAFSICVAKLHALDPSLIIGLDVGTPALDTKSLQILLEEEVKHLLGTPTVKDNMKVKRAVEAVQAPLRYTLDPPFSPFGRA